MAIDLNGFGYTQRPRSRESYTREGQAKLVLDTLDALGIARAHIVGHSYGGGITLYLAARHPERFRSMVLVDSSAPTYANDRRSRAAALRPLDALYARTVALRPGAIRKALLRSFWDDSKVTPELVRAYADRLAVEGVGAAERGLEGPPRLGGGERSGEREGQDERQGNARIFHTRFRMHAADRGAAHPRV